MSKASEFEEVESAQIIQLLKHVAIVRPPAQAWSAKRSREISATFYELSSTEPSFSLVTQSEEEAKDFKEKVQSDESPACAVSFSLPNTLLFLNTQLLGRSTTYLNFELPTKLYQVRRREYSRLQIPEISPLWSEFNHPLEPKKSIQSKILDLNEKGFAISVLESIFPNLFKKGDSVENIRFSIQGRNFKLEGQVKNHRYLKSRDEDPKKLTSRYGVSFLQVNQADADFIANYVFTETRKQFSKFL